MSEATKELREIMDGDAGGWDSVPGRVIRLCDEHERLEAEHVRICFEHTILRQRVERLERLLRAWGTEAPDAETYHRREEAVYAEAERLAKEKP